MRTRRVCAVTAPGPADSRAGSRLVGARDSRTPTRNSCGAAARLLATDAPHHGAALARRGAGVAGAALARRGATQTRQYSRPRSSLRGWCWRLERAMGDRYAAVGGGRRRPLGGETK